MSRSKLVNQAKSWIGCKESNGTHKKIIDTYNAFRPLARGYKVKYTDSWCATFVSACAIKTGFTSIIPTECGCNQMIALFKQLGEWIESDAYVPDEGDIIFYDWDDNGHGDCVGGSEHVGIVEYVSNGYITIIEGNISDSVGRRKIPVNGKFIRGFGVPKYPKDVGWKKDSNGWYYKNENGSYPISCWGEIDDVWYYFDEKGYAVCNQWKWIKGKCYFFDKQCHMISNAYIKSTSHPNFYHWVGNDGAWDEKSDSWDVRKYHVVE